MLRFIKEETVGSLGGSKLLDVDTKNFDTFLPLKRINVGEATKRALSQLNDVKEARMAMRSFLMKLCNLLKDALPLTNPLLKYLEKLHPAMRSVESNEGIRRLCIELKPLKIDAQLIDRILQEFQIYKMDPAVDVFSKEFLEQNKSTTRIDSFWKDVFDIKDKISGQPKYANLKILVINCLTLAHGSEQKYQKLWNIIIMLLVLSHGQATVESGFSQNKQLEVENLNEEFYVAKRIILGKIKYCGSLRNVVITKELRIAAAGARQKYLAHLDE
ncbi:hypothetical protein JTE90_018192 [Oedothorax gibbosus]|uniref:Uncharacterized protein n=1 Tax=Oedothorax gibbosus TaxID=931172 RepID=A0AAV6U9R1_9ARAC|nr:hypothetical protein JTE90_018192 [Oedothorax gibbosus]